MFSSDADKFIVELSPGIAPLNIAFCSSTHGITFTWQTGYEPMDDQQSKLLYDCLIKIVIEHVYHYLAGDMVHNHILHRSSDCGIQLSN